MISYISIMKNKIISTNYIELRDIINFLPWILNNQIEYINYHNYYIKIEEYKKEYYLFILLIDDDKEEYNLIIESKWTLYNCILRIYNFFYNESLRIV